MKYIFLTLSFIVSICANAQYFDSTEIANINTAKSAAEGDFYLDTINSNYYIGLTTGKLTLIGGSGRVLTDIDMDTRIEVETTPDGDSIKFYTNGSLSMVIAADGRVGIGGQPGASAVLDLRNVNNRVLQLPLTDTASVTTPLVGHLTYDSTINQASVYNGTKWKKLGHCEVTNELIFDDNDDATDYYYVSMLVDGKWKVVRYNKADVNDEGVATEATNTGVTVQPTSYGSCDGLSY